jgi:hypothetical protein
VVRGTGIKTVQPFCSNLSYQYNTLGLSKKYVFIIYLGLLLLTLVFILTGYSFTFKPLNILLLLLVIVYPIVLLFRSSIKTWLKILAGLSIISLVILVCSGIVTAIAFGGSKLRTIEKWRINNYKIVLTERQDWVGPAYKQYQLWRYRVFGLVNKSIGVGSENRENPCLINIKEEYNSNTILFKFDKCQSTLEHIQ